MKVVVVGCGGISRMWLPVACEAESIELVGLVDLNRDAAVAAAAKYGLPESVVFDSLKSAVRATGADAVFDVTVPVAHDRVTIEALELGCHVLGEKPMSDTLEKAQRMVSAAEKAGKTYAVTQTRRPLVGFKSVQAFLTGGGLGDVAELHSDFYIGAHFGGFRDEMAHPLILDMAIHTFDNARQLAGPDVDPLSVYCHAWNPKHSWYAGAASAVAVFEMTDGIVYTYRGSWCNDGRHTEWEADWRVVGSKGSLTWDGNDELNAEIIKAGGDHGFVCEMESAEVPRVEMEYEGHEYLIRQFADHVNSAGATAVECPCTDNLKSVAMVSAAVQSAEAERKVDVVW